MTPLLGLFVNKKIIKYMIFLFSFWIFLFNQTQNIIVIYSVIMCCMIYTVAFFTTFFTTFFAGSVAAATT